MSTVDVVIAVHRRTRPLARAVASVLNGNADHTRLVVVCHGVEVDRVAATLPRDHVDAITWLEHHDPRPSASGPFNAGMRRARGDFVSIMGSDDHLQPGAVASWLNIAHQTGAECVMSRLVIGVAGRPVPTPPVRPTWARPRLADPIRDRLNYRSAPLGLVSTAARRRLGAELTEGMPVGGDVAYVTRLWHETTVAVDTRGPAYVIGEDANDRVTYEHRPIARELEFVGHLIDSPWFTAYPQAARAAVAIKLLRIHLFGVIGNRPDPAWWSGEQRVALAEITAAVLRCAPQVAGPLSRADHALLSAMQDPHVSAQSLLARARRRRRHGHPQTVLPARAMWAAHREAPIRFMAASCWASRPQ